MLAFDAQQHLVSHLTLGTPLSEVYDLTKEFIAERNSSLAEKVHSNFGFGIGSSYKEELLTIRSSNNKTKVEGGMVFHVKLHLKMLRRTRIEAPLQLEIQLWSTVTARRNV